MTLFLPKGARTLDRYLSKGSTPKVKRIASQINVLSWDVESKRHEKLEVISIPIFFDIKQIETATYALIPPTHNCKMDIDGSYYSTTDFLLEMRRRINEEKQFSWKRIRGNQSRQFRMLFNERVYDLLPQQKGSDYKPSHGLVQLLGNLPNKVFDGNLKVEEVEYLHAMSHGTDLFMG